MWNWSLSGSHYALALVSGLTLPPLAAASMLLIATTVLRLLAHSTRRLGAAQTSLDAEPALTVHHVSPVEQHDAPAHPTNDGEWPAPTASEEEARRSAAAGNQRRPSRK